MKKSKGFTVDDHKEMAVSINVMMDSDLFEKIEECFPKTSRIAKQAIKIVKEIQALKGMLDDDLFNVMREAMREEDGSWNEKKITEINKIYNSRK